MRLLLTVLFFGMALTHIISVGMVRYLPVVGTMVLIFLLGKHLYYAENRAWYTIGGALILVGSIFPSILYGDALSYAYAGFAIVNFFLYPIFERVRLTDVHLGIIFVCLCVTIMPLGVGNRVVSIYDNPNNYSAVVFSTMYFGMLLFRGRLLPQILVFAFFVLLIFLAASRSMLGAILVFGLLYFSQQYVLKTTFRKLMVVGLAVIAFGYYSLITDDRFKLMETIQSNTLSDKKERGLSHRDELFNYSVELSMRQPQGYGLGMSNTALKEAYGTRISPHNTYLKIMVEGGWLALFGFCVLMFGFFLTSTSPLATSFLFALMIRGFFESSTPFTVSFISGMLIIPMFLNEWSVDRDLRLVFRKEDNSLPADNAVPIPSEQ
ncbi:O-antigen ligase family protein [Neolewinella persica]|uniref:O-antigen ligase family protein n=1 Tax=Neolewinella persica TaxID=70998 RepID=UPI000368A791|nr:O-antigen ligase family protein [Neolewinella persica]